MNSNFEMAGSDCASGETVRTISVAIANDETRLRRRCLCGGSVAVVEIRHRIADALWCAPKACYGCRSWRLALLSAVLEKRLGVNLWDQDIYLNVVGGLEVDEPAADLAIVAAILSSFFNKAVGGSTVVFGEVGLGGEIRQTMFSELRLKEALMLGFTRAVTPLPAAPSDLRSNAMEILPVRNIQEAQDALFGT
jgi:DNA repair protein RadA/Sms